MKLAKRLSAAALAVLMASAVSACGDTDSSSGGGSGDTESEALVTTQPGKALEESQKELEEKEFTAKAGGGAVEVTITGKREITKLKLSEEAVDPDDIETLEDLVMAAVNEALRMVEEESSQNMGKLTGGLGGALPF